MNLYDTAIRIWIARKIFQSRGKFYDAEAISDVKFGEDGGYWYSEYTNDYDKTAIQFKLRGENDYIIVEGTNPAKMIEECLKIYQTLGHLGAEKIKTL